MREPRPSAPRIAVVLGAAVWSGGRPSPTLKRRAGHAVALFKAGSVDAILGCGGVGRYPPSEAEVIAQICRDDGIPEAAVFQENRSTTTRENLSFAQPILAKLAPSKVVIVTDPYHAPRVALIARQTGLRATIETPQAKQIGPRQWLRHILRETFALAATVLRLR